MSAIINKKQYFYISHDGVGVEKYTLRQLYEKLVGMDEFSQLNLIKNINKTYGSEVVNMKMLTQMFENTPSPDKTVEVKVEKQDETDTFAKDYMKAYMKLLSS